MSTTRLHARLGWHRTVFAAAGLYNIAWGLFAAVDPQWLFRFSDVQPMLYPQIYQAMGMVVGVYGILYFEVARRPERGWLIAAVGFLGKVLGPIGMYSLVVDGIWPLRMAMLCVTNDLIWWLPFMLYLVDAWPHFRSDWAGTAPTEPGPVHESGEPAAPS